MNAHDRRPLLRRLLCLVFMAGSLGIAGAALAKKPVEFQSDKEQQLYRDVAAELRCPTCTGLSVLESDTPFSEQIKSIVKEQVESGKSEAEILAYFTTRYGLWILRSPPKEGFNMLAWLLPAAVLALGPLGVWLAVWRRRRVLTAAQGVRPADEIVAQMHRELDAMRSARSRAKESV